MLYAVVEVNGDHLVSEVMDLFLICADLIVLCLELLELFRQLHSLGCGGGCHALLDIRNGGAVTRLLLEHIIRANTSNGIRLVTVHIDERLEAALFAAVEQPVDGTFLINLAVVGIEVIEKISANDLFW